MIDKETKDAINYAGKELSLDLPGFFGKITFNFQNGNYVSSNVEHSVRLTEPLSKGADKC